MAKRSKHDEARQVKARLRMLRHFEQVTRNVSRTCRFFGISRSQFYFWQKRHREGGVAALRDGKRGPRNHPFRTPPHIEALVLQVRRERQYGSQRLSMFLERYHQVYISPPTIHRILRDNNVPKIPRRRFRPGPKRRRVIREPGRSVQVDVKHLRLRGRRLYQFTAIDEATRYRVLQVYDHNNVRSATDFVEQLRTRLPVAIERIKTDNGSEFGQDFTWHLHDLGIEHRRNPPGCPECNGKVERSHRTDAEEFYRRTTFRSPDELRAKLKRWEAEYNERRPHLALKGKTPSECLAELRIRRNSLPLEADLRTSQPVRNLVRRTA